MEIKCSTKDTIKLTECVPFQGNLKKRTPQDIQELKESLLREGLLMPFAIWVHEGKKYLLDGHGRKEALVQLAVEDANLLNVDWPCVYIEAEDEDSARKALLQITSAYGKITKIGVKQFTITIPDYTAPAIAKFKPKLKTGTKISSENMASNKSNDLVTKRIIKIRVSRDKEAQVLDIFKQFDFIEVL